MGKIWFYMISIGIVGSIITDNLGELNKVILNEASRGVEFAISLAGVMALWMGIMNIAKDSGLIDKIGKKLNPIMRRLFPSIPKGHKAMSYMVMNMALNMVGAGNGATAFGLKAMEELQTLNNKKDTKLVGIFNSNYPKYTPMNLLFGFHGLRTCQLRPSRLLKYYYIFIKMSRLLFL